MNRYVSIKIGADLRGEISTKKKFCWKTCVSHDADSQKMGYLEQNTTVWKPQSHQHILQWSLIIWPALGAALQGPSHVPWASPPAPLTQSQEPPGPDFLQYSQVTSPRAELSL